jgi:hypothetical protein
MKGNRAAIAAVVAVVLLLAGWVIFRGRNSADGVDLIEQLAGATKQPATATFAVTDVTINGETHKSIDATPPTRLTWRVKVPDDAWLRVQIGMKPESWTAEGDGVLFYVVASDGRSDEKLFEQYVNPFANQGERKWIPVMVDLSQYAGEEMNIIFNTRTSPASNPPRDDNRNDFAVWGAPEIVTK